MTTHERDMAHIGANKCNWYADELQESAEFRKEYRQRMGVIKAADMPFENSPDGLIKHMVNERMNSTENCVEAYMQFIPPGSHTGKRRILAEQILFVLDGHGYDLHWDVEYEVDTDFTWTWKEEPRKFEWERGDFIFVPAYCTQQHFNADPDNEARIIVITNRIFKAMGLNWLEQIENAPEYDGDLETMLAGPGWLPDTRD